MRLASAWVWVCLGVGLVSCGSDPDSGGGGNSGSSGASGTAGVAGAGGQGGTAGAGGGTGAGGSGAGTAGVAGTAGSGAAGAGGGPSNCHPDADGDGILDEFEGRDTNRDSDGDGIPDYLDLDSDNDGIPDYIEGDPTGCDAPDSDNDGLPNFIDLDSDNNGIPDAEEAYPDGSPYDPNRPLSDIDGDGLPDVYDPDNDGDFLSDVEELMGQPPVDTDGDGAFDHNDPDSDNDGIRDDYEGTDDTDGDGIPDFRDLDSDGDGVPDACEAGAGHTLNAPPANTDGDANADAYDIDSDNDGLLDSFEDANGDCVVNVGETDRIRADTDGDGASDLIERELGSNPTSASETPQSMGKYYFVMPFGEPPSPLQQNVVLKTNLNKADVAFVVDTTGSMGGAIANIRTNLTSLMNNIRAAVEEAHFGVASFTDYPVSPYGGPGDLPVSVPPDGFLTADPAKTTAAVAALSATTGYDLPESQIAALHKVLSNGALTWPPSGSQPPFSPGNGGFGGLGFRTDALPVLILVTDAAMHNGRRKVCATSPFQACRSGCCNQTESSLHDTYSFVAPTADDLATRLQATGAKFIGIALNGGGTQRYAAPYPDMAFLSDASGSSVKVNAFGGSTCATDVAGNPVLPDGPTIDGVAGCRLIFAGYGDGSNTSASIDAGVRALLAGIEVSVRLRAIPNLAPPYLAVDAVNDFIETIAVYPQGNIQDPAEPGTFCEFVPATHLEDNWADKYGVLPGSDGVNETVRDLVPGTRVCFRIVPKPNTTVPQTYNAQVLSVRLRVLAKNEGQDDELLLGSPREVLFVIPPIPQ
ncbi:MAG: hypothetical protein KIT72_03650 [Polyangiaceae bacterium]|nr:hypothetical protein [Polyangiaceae bacterium]MCW5789496.1 hypothetical protein [Polyangiaceae bacterium]